MIRLLLTLAALHAMGWAQDAEPRLITVELQRPPGVAPDTTVTGVAVASVDLTLEDAIALATRLGYSQQDLERSSTDSSTFGISGYIFTKRGSPGLVREVLSKVAALPAGESRRVGPFVSLLYSDALVAKTEMRLAVDMVNEARRDAAAIASVTGVRLKQLVAVRLVGTGLSRTSRAEVVPVVRYAADGSFSISPILWFVGSRPSGQVTYQFDFSIE